MRTFARYMAFQVPGWLLAALLLSGFARWTELSTRLALLLFGLWLLKDFLLYPLLRVAYEPRPASSDEGLVGARGIAQEDLAPRGYVRLGAELWRARVPAEVAPIRAGTEVRVVAVRGLTLVVAPNAGDPPGESG